MSYRYDLQGRMVSRMAYLDGTLVSTESYLWEAYNPIAKLDSGLSLVQAYVWGIDMSDTFQGAGGVGGLLLVEAGPACYVPAYDHRGNVVDYLDAADGSTVASFAYGPFGETLRETGPKVDELTYRFSTKPTDPTTKFIHYELRTYDPIMGRWLSRDPIEERGGLNLYGMVNNDLLNRIDYLGKGQLLSWSLFKHWLFGYGTPKRLNWEDFDSDGTAADALKRTWVLQNLQALKELCKDSSDGASHVTGPVGARTRAHFITTETPFISWWTGDAWNHVSGVTINHKKSKCECRLEFGLDLKAHDVADFNPGEHFGHPISIPLPVPPILPMRSVPILPDGIPDDSMIWVRDNVPGVGTDFRIYALSYVKGTQTVGYSN